MEAPHLQRLHKKYFARGLRLIAVTEMDPGVTDVRQFIKRHGLTYPVVLDPGERAGKQYRVEGHPTAFLLDRKGVVRFVHVGFLPGDEKLLDTAIQAVLAGKTPPKGDS